MPESSKYIKIVPVQPWKAGNPGSQIWLLAESCLSETIFGLIVSLDRLPRRLVSHGGFLLDYKVQFDGAKLLLFNLNSKPKKARSSNVGEIL